MHVFHKIRMRHLGISTLVIDLTECVDHVIPFNILEHLINLLLFW